MTFANSQPSPKLRALRNKNRPENTQYSPLLFFDCGETSSSVFTRAQETVDNQTVTGNQTRLLDTSKIADAKDLQTLHSVLLWHLILSSCKLSSFNDLPGYPPFRVRLAWFTQIGSLRFRVGTWEAGDTFLKSVSSFL